MPQNEIEIMQDKISKSELEAHYRLKFSNKIALFIDCENINHKSCYKIMQKLSEIGEVCVKKAYGDWGNQNLAPWKAMLAKYSIEPIQVSSIIKAKNASDIRLTIDVMHALYRYNMDCIALATSDSDFALLAQEVRRWTLPAIGFGRSGVRDELRHSFSAFYEIDEPVLAATSKTIQTNKSADELCGDEIFTLLCEAIKSTRDAQSWANVSKITEWITKNYGIKSTFYGKKTWGKAFKHFCKHTNMFEIRYEGLRNCVMMVRIVEQDGARE